MSLNLQLILGGTKSGKSRFALVQGDEPAFARRFFLATATALDEEMKQRIERHQKERDPGWLTREEPYHLSAALDKLESRPDDLTVVDCATLWISNLLCGMGGKALAPEEIEKEVEIFLQGLKQHKGRIRIVSNEVGGGIVPENLLARQFQNLQGELNKSLASIATQVILMTAGLPQKIK